MIHGRDLGEGLCVIGYVSPTDCAWAAGFFDGEGAVWCSLNPGSHGAGRPRRQHRAIACQIGQVDREVLDRFAGVVGVGSVRGPYVTGGLSVQPLFQFACRTRVDVGRVFSCLEPYLGSVKRSQFKRALEKYDSFISMRKTTDVRKVEIAMYIQTNPAASQKEIATHFGISQARVNQVLHEER